MFKVQGFGSWVGLKGLEYQGLWVRVVGVKFRSRVQGKAHHQLRLQDKKKSTKSWKYHNLVIMMPCLGKFRGEGPYRGYSRVVKTINLLPALMQN